MTLAENVAARCRDMADATLKECLREASSLPRNSRSTHPPPGSLFSFVAQLKPPGIRPSGFRSSATWTGGEVGHAWVRQRHGARSARSGLDLRITKGTPRLRGAVGGRGGRQVKGGAAGLPGATHTRTRSSMPHVAMIRRTARFGGPRRVTAHIATGPGLKRVGSYG